MPHNRHELPGLNRFVWMKHIGADLVAPLYLRIFELHALFNTFLLFSSALENPSPEDGHGSFPILFLRPLFGRMDRNITREVSYADCCFPLVYILSAWATRFGKFNFNITLRDNYIPLFKL